jgi:hypothetical protein
MAALAVQKGFNLHASERNKRARVIPINLVRRFVCRRPHF